MGIEIEFKNSSLSITSLSCRRDNCCTLAIQEFAKEMTIIVVDDVKCKGSRGKISWTRLSVYIVVSMYMMHVYTLKKSLHELKGLDWTVSHATDALATRENNGDELGARKNRCWHRSRTSNLEGKSWKR